MRNPILFLLLAETMASLAFGQQQQLIPDIYGIPFIGAESTATNAVKVVFAVQVAQPKPDGTLDYKTIGSGFFCHETLTNGAYVELGITCNHVVNAVPPQTQLFIGVDTTNDYIRMPCTVPYKDPTNDIAIMNPLPLKGQSSQIKSKDMSFATNNFDDGTSLALGRGVLIVGYPLGFGVNGNKNNPIVRFGMIAQNAEDNTFLIDGMASHGNSGSPVIELYATHQNFLGMVNTFLDDSIDLSNDGVLSARLPYNSGLSSVIKASVILKDIEEAKKENLLTPMIRQ